MTKRKPYLDNIRSITVLLVTCCLLHNYTNLAPSWKYAIALVADAAGAMLLNGIIKRFPCLRRLVLGMK